MIKDYKSSPAKKPKTPAWVIFISGAAVGALIATLILTKIVSPQTPSPVSNPGIAQQDSADTTKRFTFYDILSGNEQLISQKSQEQSTDNFQTVTIQIGAFQDGKDADNLQAQTALLGFDPKIETVDLPDKGGRWFRVRIGPLNTPEELRTTTERLEQHKVAYVLVKSK